MKHSSEISQKPLLNEYDNFMIKIQKKNPKKNAPVHDLKTVQDIFDVVNKSNLNKFIKEFKHGLQIGIEMRELSKTLAEENDVEIGDKVFQMQSFTWIED